MTGDGAVVRDALTPEQTARWMEAIAKCMKHPGDVIPVAALQAGARYIRQQAAEIERLTTGGIIEVAVRNMNVRHYVNHWEGRTERAEALTAQVRLQNDELKARTADLLKALERAPEIPTGLAVMTNQQLLTWGLDYLDWWRDHRTTSLAAAKGETVL